RPLATPGRCHDCGKALASSFGFAKRRRGGAERPHQCPECGKCFRLASALLGHQRRHGAGKAFRCPDCGKAFAGAAAFVQHQRVHLGATTGAAAAAAPTPSPCQCGVCGKSFPASSGL
ncbi:ZN397 protein, partial [Eubucco bourcierii]|nr:ZN397 protein [Eubucco bourcierii]